MNFKNLILLLILTSTICVNGQDPLRKNSFGLYQTFTDYNVELLNGKYFAFDSSFSQSTRLGYQRRLSRTWMLNTGLSNGFILNQNIKDGYMNKAYALGLDASFMFKFNNGRIMKENPRVAPFASFGYRADYIPQLTTIGETPWLMSNQYGIGFNVKLGERTHIQLRVALDQKLQGDFNSHIQYRTGITQSLGRLEDKPALPKKDLDSDMDGIIDSKDECPARFGLKESNGCPDTNAYFSRKIAYDSMQEAYDLKSKELSEVELALAELRGAGTDYKVDTVIITKTVVEVDESAVAELLRLEEEKKRLEAQLSAEKLARLEAESLATENSNELSEAERLAKLKAAEDARLAKVEADRIAAEREALRMEQEKLEAERLAREKALREEREGKQDDEIEEEIVVETPVTPEIPADKNYYVITISSPNMSTVNAWLAKMKKDFRDAVILPQPNGYYRVGVYVGKDKQKGLEILEQVKQIGYDPAWLSVE